MRLVVLSEEQKQAVLEECHYNPGTGNHNGVRRTRDRVIAGYYWSTIKADVTDWVKNICHRINVFYCERARLKAAVLNSHHVCLECNFYFYNKSSHQVKSCHRCQLNTTVKTVSPVLHPVKVSSFPFDLKD